MLNRRILRSKALRAIYAYKQAQLSNFHLAVDYIENLLEPDLNSMDIPEPETVAAEKLSATTLFKNNYLKKEIEATEELSHKIKNVAIKGIQQYHQFVKKDAKYYKDTMLGDVDTIYSTYISALKLIISLSDFVNQENEERKNRQFQLTPVFQNQLKFYTNGLVEKLRKSENLRHETDIRRTKWDNDLIRSWYKALKQDKTYQEYVELTESTFEQDKAFVEYLAKDFMFKNEAVAAHFEETDIHWDENKAILRSMINKTIKGISEEMPVDLQELSSNWEEDREFFEDLYRETVGNEAKLEDIISKKLNNWDIERIGILDKVLLELAITEMITFPSIPVKVTINEYIELAKAYGAPRSKEFVNGMLDVISNDLVEKGVVRKSGRGLIDNR